MCVFMRCGGNISRDGNLRQQAAIPTFFKRVTNGNKLGKNLMQFVCEKLKTTVGRVGKNHHNGEEQTEKKKHNVLYYRAKVESHYRKHLAVTSCTKATEECLVNETN